MKYPKLVIISDGNRVAVLLDGVFYGRGVSEVLFEKKTNSAPTLSMDGIDTELFSHCGASDFEQVWASFLRDELGAK